MDNSFLRFVIPVLVLILAAGGAVGFVMLRNRQRLAGSEAVATALGLTKRIQLKQMWWYEGKWEDGRLFGFVPISMHRRSYSYVQERTTTRYDSAVRIIVELLVANPLGIEVVRHIRWANKRPLDSFDNAFNVENGDKLTLAMKEALLDFVRLNPGTLWLADRATISPRLITSPEIMQDTTAVLLYEYKATNPEVDMIKAKMVELADLARALENS